MPNRKKQFKMDDRAFADHILFDFVDALDTRLEELGLTRREFASRMGVSEGRISQVFNDPANFTMRKMVELSRNLGLKVSLVSFEDKDDPSGAPVFSTSFKRSWEILGKPKFEDELNRLEELCKDCVGRRHKDSVIWTVLRSGPYTWEEQEGNMDITGAAEKINLPYAS